MIELPLVSALLAWTALGLGCNTTPSPGPAPEQQVAQELSIASETPDNVELERALPVLEKCPVSMGYARGVSRQTKGECFTKKLNLGGL
jgi:hypothetical protein